MQMEKLTWDYLSLLRIGAESDHMEEKFKEIDTKELYLELANDNRKKTFWINIYNAFNILFLKHDPHLLETQKSRRKLFNSKLIYIGKQKLSLNDIKHGLLRHSKIWWSKGYLSKPFIGRFERRFRVDVADYRIHFVLNCGGLPCPPVDIYESSKIEQQLEAATENFLNSDVSFFEEENLVTISQIFNWYAGDFGGRTGILNLLKRYNLIPQDSTPMIIYKPYKWMPDI
jgi:hypothetical protein